MNGNRDAGGVISGAVLRAARNTARLTQEDAAGLLAADLGTVKGWETGRRPLGRVQAGRLSLIKRRLREHGARPTLLGALDTAIDADAFTARAVTGDCGSLGREVSTRQWTSLVAWAALGEPLQEAGDVAQSRPLLCAADRSAFFASLRDAAEREAPGTTGDLLRHQAYYLAAWDASPAGTAWLADAERAEFRRTPRPGTWVPQWAVTRSLAVAQACQGDREPLRWFIRHHLADAACDDANLAYWAYWIGCDPEPASSEVFMSRRRTDARRAAALMWHLTGTLSADLPYAELSVHTIGALCRRWPGLTQFDPDLAHALRSRVGLMLDGDGLPKQVRRDLSDLERAARLAGAGTPEGTLAP